MKNVTQGQFCFRVAWRRRRDAPPLREVAGKLPDIGHDDPVAPALLGGVERRIGGLMASSRVLRTPGTTARNSSPPHRAQASYERSALRRSCAV